jgi:hypothetical protein
MFFYRESDSQQNSGLELIPNNNAAAAFSSTANVMWNATNGYYISTNNWGYSTTINTTNLSAITKIEATFTGYYDQPSSCLGNNYIAIRYTDGNESYIGTQDAWSLPEGGQVIYKGDAGTERTQDGKGATRNVVNETYTLTADPAKTIQSIIYYSSYLSGYPESTRGVKDIKIYR